MQNDALGKGFFSSLGYFSVKLFVPLIIFIYLCQY